MFVLKYSLVENVISPVNCAEISVSAAHFDLSGLSTVVELDCCAC